MTTPDAIAPNKNTIVARIAWLALILTTLYVCYFSHLGAIGFVGPDEPRYAWIARDMAETGDWVTPRLYGRPWFEKPPLYYWGAAICFKSFGVSEAAARLPSAISALLATLAMAWLAWRLYGAETARWLLLLLTTTVGMIGFSHAAATDMPFSAMLTIAMVCAAVVVGLVPDKSRRDEAQRAVPLQEQSDVGRQRWLALILFGFFLGLAVLAKGPAGVILCGGAVFFWALFTKRWRDAFRLFHPAAVAIFCLTALPWYILCARRNPDFFRIFIIEHNFKRYLTPEFQHIQPFWYYVPIVLFAIFPWVMVISAIANIFRRKLGMQFDALTIYILFWAFFPVIFFSISKSKLPGYILPAVPPLALLATFDLTRLLREENPRVPARFAGLALIPVSAIAVIGLSLLFESASGAAAFRWYGLECLLLSSIAIVAILALLTRKRYVVAVITGSVAWLCLLILTTSGPLRSIDPWFSSRPIAFEVLRDRQIAAEVRTLGLQRAWKFGLNFYLRRELQEWDPSTPEGYVLASASGMQKLNQNRIPFQVLEDRSFEATLIRIGNPQADRNQRQKTELPRRSAAQRDFRLSG